MLDLIDRAARRLSLFAIWGGGLLLLAAAILVTADVLGRRFLGLTLGGADELAGYAFAVGTAWAFSYVLLQRGNVRIDAGYRLLPLWARAGADLVSLAALFVFVAFLVWRAGVLLQTTIELGARSVTPMRTPLVVPQGLWFAGLVLFLAVITLTLLRCLAALWRRDAVGVQEIAGAAGVEAEFEDEVRAMRLTRPEG